MSDTVYRVVIDYELRGDVDRPAARATGRLGDLDRAARHVVGAFDLLGGKLATFGGAVADAFTGAVERAGQLAATVAGVGVAAALGAVTYGAIHLNSELEQTSLSLAAIFNAQGYSRDFGDAMGIAADQVAKMKKDVMTLPGDLGQLGAIMKTIATPAAQAGMSPDAMRELAGRSMLVGGIEQLAPDLVAREMAQLLSGRAGAHNILGTRLGLIGSRAQTFNAEAPAARVADVRKELDRFGPAADAFGKSWFANWTTLKDNVKYTLLAPTTSPLFESVKRTVVGINGWFENHKAYVGGWADYVGRRLADAFEGGKTMILSWWPAIEVFAVDAYGRISRVWREIEPVVSRVGGAIKESLANGQALDKVESILKLYAGIKTAQALAPLAGAGFSAIGGAFGAGGSGAAGAAAGLGGALGATGLAAAGAASAMAVTAAAGELMALVNPASAHHDQAVAAAKDLEHATSRLAGDFDYLWVRIKPGIEWFGVEGTTELTKFAEGLDSVLSPMELARGAVDVFADKLRGSGGMLEELLQWLEQKVHEPKLNPDVAPKIDRDYPLSPGMFVRAMGQAAQEQQQKKLAPKPGAGGGGGGTSIHTVQINLSTNQEPSRIARRVVDMIADIGRHPTASRHAPNWSRART